MLHPWGALAACWRPSPIIWKAISSLHCANSSTRWNGKETCKVQTANGVVVRQAPAGMSTGKSDARQVLKDAHRPGRKPARTSQVRIEEQPELSRGTREIRQEPQTTHGLQKPSIEIISYLAGPVLRRQCRCPAQRIGNLLSG